MSTSRVTLGLALALAATAGLGCKKKPTDTTPVTSAPLPAEATKEVPREVQEMKANFERVFFDFDSSELTDTTKTLLDSNVALMGKKTDIKVEVQGHADERGTTDYNLALGQRRAKAVRDYMTNAGVSPTRIKTISMGEERPLVAADGETAWAQNRRAEFRVYEGGDGKVVGTVQ